MVGSSACEDLILGSLIVLLIALPMLAISIAVKLTSPGPVFFRQRRYGLHGQGNPRPEVPHDDGVRGRSHREASEQERLAGHSHRLVPEAYVLDELPQFLQVITGEMSIVGPRPHAVAHNEEYRRLISGYMLRHKVKPGITGWAQVNGWRGETDALEKMQKRVEHDLEYIRNWRLSLDIWIIFMTVFGSKARKNAY